MPWRESDDDRFLKNRYLPSQINCDLKHAVSILLLSLLAFNWVGYRLLNGAMQNSADLALETKIEHSDYDEASLIEIRVPLNAPYLIDGSAEFERYDGELELHGVHYQYVKRKVENGELVLLCIPNESKTDLQNSRVEFFKLVNDLNHSQSKGKTNTTSFKSVTTEYKQEINSWSLAALPLAYVTHARANISLIESGYNLIPEHPPKG